MPILNYTTEIDVYKTMGEIQRILIRCKARQVTIDYSEAGLPEAISFIIPLQGRPIQFKLRTHQEGVLRRLVKDPDVPRKYKTADQASRVAWRIKKDLLEAQLAAIDAEEAELAELFLSWAVDPRTGMTVYEQFQANLALGPGQTVEGEVTEANNS